MTTHDDAADDSMAGFAHPYEDPERTLTDDPLDRDRYRARCGCGWRSDKLRRNWGMASHDFGQHERTASDLRRALQGDRSA
jgi:hypothetical protein